MGACGACGLARQLKKGFCRLCWCQARLDRLAVAGNARDAVVLGPYLSEVRHHQPFLSGFDRRYAPLRTTPRRYGAKGRPLKAPPPVAGAPAPGWVQAALFDAGPRTYRYSSIDLRSRPAPDNPWLAWGLHLAHTIAEARGWPETVRRAMQRALVMLLAEHRSGERIRVSDFKRIVTRRGTDVVAYSGTLHGHSRRMALSALRSLFGWAKRTGTIFRNPTVNVHGPRREHAIWQPLPAAAIAAASTVQARVFVALSAVHAARPGQIRAMH